MAKVSIIVPIYNAEKYLHRSIVSLQKQTIKDIEIILVNDGSTDNSLSICNQYAQNDSRIKVIDKQNGGVSSARNRGIEISTGEYLGFIDPDDWVESDMYKNMYKISKSTHSDVVMSNYVIEGNKNKEHVLLPIEKDILNRKEIINTLIPPMISRDDLNGNGENIMGSVWRLLVKRDLIIRNNIKFPLQVHLMEDLIFCLKVFLKSNNISIDRGCYYHYVNNENSAMTSYRKNMYKEQKKAFNIIEEILKHEKIYIELEKRMEIRYINMHISSIVNETHKLSNNNILNKLKNINNICKDNKLRVILNDINFEKCNIRKRILLNSIKKNIYFYPYIYYSLINFIKNSMQYKKYKF